MTSASNGYGIAMEQPNNSPGTRLTCTNDDCPCELQINTPCPHGSIYTCACGHDLRAVPA